MLSPGVPRSIGLAIVLPSIRSEVDMACGEPSASKNEKADSAGDTRPLSRLVTVNIWPAGVGKSLAVGVGTRGDSGEIDLDRVEEGMLQLTGTVGVRVELEWKRQDDSRNDRGSAGLRGCLMKESLRTWMCFSAAAHEHWDAVGE